MATTRKGRSSEAKYTMRSRTSPGSISFPVLASRVAGALMRWSFLASQPFLSRLVPDYCVLAVHNVTTQQVCA